MGKVKSAIITALLLAAIITLTLFATISCNVPGSNGVKRYNSFISSIPLGSEFSGDASVIIYPEGVITEEIYERDTYENADKLEEYEEKYEHLEEIGLYVDKDKLHDENDNDVSAKFVESIKVDAKIISDRLSEKGYSSYSVAVVDGYGIKITVPTGMSYAAYKGYDTTTRSNALTEISHTITYLSLDGALTLRSGSEYADNNSLYFEKEENEFNSFIKNAKLFTKSGTTAVRINLTNDGFKKFNDILTGSSDATTAYLYVGKTNLQLTFSIGTALESKSLYFQSQKSYSQDYAILVNSVAHGNMLTNRYNENSTASLVPMTAVYGEHSAIYLAVLVLVVILLAACLPVFKYKKLGLINAMMVLAYSAAIATALMLTGIQLTIGGVFTAILGLALLCFSNFYTFEVIRRESALGRTIGASVKLGYKKSIFAVLDVHVILVVATIFMILVGAGELASCGLILLIGSLMSIVLYWLTRFMWYALSSSARNKFSFCGFVREVEDDE